MYPTIAICCHNSAQRLPATLEHLSQQAWGGDWELLLIDNASTDATTNVAESCWAEYCGQRSERMPNLRIVHEPNPGLSHARRRAFHEATGEMVCFLDDDNWAPPEWLSHVVGIFHEHPEVAAVGGPITEVLEKEPPPPWFERFKGNFTIWNPWDTADYWDKPLCGAGLCVRKSAWESLIKAGFQFQLSDRQGKNLSSGGDFELCYALLLLGWKLWYDPRLHIRHFMPKERLTWENLCRLNYGFGQQSVVFDAYSDAPPRPWWWEALLAKTRLFRTNRRRSMQVEGDPIALFAEQQQGRLDALYSSRGLYTQRHQAISQWIKNGISES